ncbi:MAG: glycosyltransferase [Muribaculaceae bacterium]|nr:glycosyltransferase [Muribaculaceae bacterium]
MKSILFLVDSLRVGGAERALVSLLTHIDVTKYEITVLSITDGGEFAERIQSIDRVDYRYLISSQSSFLDKLKYKLIYSWLPPRLSYRLFVPKGHDVEIAFCEGYTTKLIGASTNLSARRIAWVHTDLLDNNWPLKSGIFSNLEEEKSCYARFDTVAGVSEIVVTGLKTFLPNKDIRRVYNLVDSEEIISKSREQTCFPHDLNCFNIVSVGRLERVKGFDRLVEAVARLREEGVANLSLTIVGDGTHRQFLSDMIKEYGLESTVTLTGSQSNPYSIMRGKDLFVCSSRCEGYNLAIAEAMVLGIPIVSTRCSGPVEILQDGKYGVLCDNSVEGLYNTIKLFVQQPGLCNQYAQLSKERSNFFRIDSVINQIEQLL